MNSQQDSEDERAYSFIQKERDDYNVKAAVDHHNEATQIHDIIVDFEEK